MLTIRIVFSMHLEASHMVEPALVQAAAMDVVLSECGMPRLLPCLRRECNEYKGRMLVFLVGYAWQTIRAHDASTINTHLIVHKWMEASCAWEGGRVCVRWSVHSAWLAGWQRLARLVVPCMERRVQSDGEA